MILDARVRAGWIEAPAPEAEPAAQRKAKAHRRRRDRSIGNEELERRSRVGADLHRDGDQGRSRGDAALRARPRRIGCPGYPPQAARPRGLDAAELRDGEAGRPRSRRSRARFAPRRRRPPRWPRRSTRFWSATRCSRCRSPTRPASSSPARSRSMRRSRPAASRRSFRRATGRRTERPSEPKSCARNSARRRKPSRASISSRRGNWIWHWGGQM